MRYTKRTSNPLNAASGHNLDELVSADSFLLSPKNTHFYGINQPGVVLLARVVNLLIGISFVAVLSLLVILLIETTSD